MFLKLLSNSIFMSSHDKFMSKAIELSINNVKNGGGPFGAVIVKDDEIIAEGFNQVTQKNDPTAHAEVTAIRIASEKLGSFDLSGCVIYTSCEPCPMCLGAIYWARLDAIYFANTKADAHHIGFSDQFIYEEIEKPVAERSVPTIQMMNREALKAFEDWSNNKDKTVY